MYGHTSRIWKLAHVSGNDGSMVLASSSEDATCKIWKVNNDEQKEVTTLKGHIGRNVRALSTKGDLVATGGEDGSVKVWNLNKIIALQQDSSDEVTEIKTRIPMPGSDEIHLQTIESGAATQTKLSEKQK